MSMFMLLLRRPAVINYIWKCDAFHFCQAQCWWAIFCRFGVCVQSCISPDFSRPYLVHAYREYKKFWYTCSWRTDVMHTRPRSIAKRSRSHLTGVIYLFLYLLFAWKNFEMICILGSPWLNARPCSVIKRSRSHIGDKWPYRSCLVCIFSLRWRLLK